MAAPVVNPLTAQHLAALNQGLQALVVVRDLCERTGRCGIDVTPTVAQEQALRETITGLKREFFPDHA